MHRSIPLVATVCLCLSIILSSSLLLFTVKPIHSQTAIRLLPRSDDQDDGGSQPPAKKKRTQSEEETQQAVSYSELLSVSSSLPSPTEPPDSLQGSFSHSLLKQEESNPFIYPFIVESGQNPPGQQEPSTSYGHHHHHHHHHYHHHHHHHQEEQEEEEQKKKEQKKEEQKKKEEEEEEERRKKQKRKTFIIENLQGVQFHYIRVRLTQFGQQRSCEVVGSKSSPDDVQLYNSLILQSERIWQSTKKKLRTLRLKVQKPNPKQGERIYSNSPFHRAGGLQRALHLNHMYKRQEPPSYLTKAKLTVLRERMNLQSDPPFWAPLCQID